MTIIAVRLWLHIKNSIWFIPAICTILSIGLAFTMISIDRRFQMGNIVVLQWFIYDVGAEGARGVLGVIAGSIITVTGVVFSITVVALQLASSQFTPRVLRSFIADRTNQLVLGCFIGTFTYALLVQRSVRSAYEDFGRFVPSFAVTVALLLALLSIAMLIRFIDHITRSIRASHLIDRVTYDVRAAIDNLFPEQFGKPDPAESDVLEAELERSGEPLLVRAKGAGYLQTIDNRQIFRMGKHWALTIRMEQDIGAFVLPGEVLCSVWANGAIDEQKVCRRLQSACVLGANRTNEQDITWGLVELSDIAVKALSPGINDPTTATLVIDRLGEGLVLLGNRKFPDRLRSSDDGRIRLIARRVSYAHAVDAAFAPIRHYGADQPMIITRLLKVLSRVAVCVPEARRAPLEHEIAVVHRQAERTIASTSGRERVEDAAYVANERLRGDNGS